MPGVDEPWEHRESVVEIAPLRMLRQDFDRHSSQLAKCFDRHKEQPEHWSQKQEREQHQHNQPRHGASLEASAAWPIGYAAYRRLAAGSRHQSSPYFWSTSTS